MSIRSTIFEAMLRIADEQKISLPLLRDDMSLHETGFDSLAFAILVARLEDDLGSDPLAADDAELPSTVGDFVRAYENVAALDTGVARTPRLSM
jgi:acyl carrier protein